MHNPPSVAFDQLCAFVAIRETQDQEEVLRQLIVHLIELFKEESFDSAESVRQKIEDVFGLSLSNNRVQGGVDGCLGRGLLTRDRDGRLHLHPSVQAGVREKLATAEALEDRVRQGWLEEVASVAPELDPAIAWGVLEAYLTKLFRQHGLHTIALADPALVVPEALQVSLRAMLQEELADRCPPEFRDILHNLVEAFFAGVTGKHERIALIVHIADAVASYYSLTIRSDLAAQLRTRLEPLTLFLDTNVLFGLIGLDVAHLVDISNELVAAANDHGLPLRLRYHSATESELRNTFEAVTSKLSGIPWSPQISRAAARSSKISTIQRLFHERNAKSPVTAETFFAPYKHMDVILQEQEIKVYREGEANRQDVYDLIEEYKTFLAKYGREKSYEALDHDMTVLNAVRRLRSTASSSLQAKALLVTYDYLLHRFDWVTARRKGDLPCAVLPNQLLQILRPFLPITADFDRSFAETFAIPEFRAMGGKAQAAMARMLQIMASYEGLSEESASAILANDVILDGLKRSKSDDELRTYVESAIAAENSVLAQQNRQLEQALSAAQSEREQAVAEAEQRLKAQLDASEAKLRDDLCKSNETGLAVQADLQREQERIAHVEAELQRERDAKKESDAKAIATQGAFDEISGRLRALESAKADSDARARWYSRMFVAAVIAGLIVAVAELALHAADWRWLLDHQDSYGIRGAVYVALISSVVAIADRDRRGKWLGLGLVGAALVVLQLVGGPR